LKQKFRAFARNQNILFSLALIGIVITVLAWRFPNFWNKTDMPVQRVTPSKSTEKQPKSE